MTSEHGRMAQWHWMLNVGQQWLAQVQQGANLETVEKLLRRDLTVWQASMLIEQIRLRRRAVNRFPDAEKWWWTDRGLQQASDWCCALFKAQLIPPNERVIDCCCGVGADLVALANRFDVMGIDRDPIVSLLAAANLRSHNVHGHLVVGELPSIIGLNQAFCLHIDPDRRPQGRRVSQGEGFSPPLAEVLSMAGRSRGTIIKLAPATDVTVQSIGGFQRGWIGSAGQCRQQLLIRGACCTSFTAERFAALCDHPDSPEVYQWHSPIGQTPDISDQIGDYVYDIHPVLHAANLQSEWAQEKSLRAITAPAGYFTSSMRLESAWLQRFRVLDVLAWDQRKVRSWLRHRMAGIVEVKKRLVELDANLHQRRLSQTDGEPVTLLITRMANKTIAIAAKRD